MTRGRSVRPFESLSPAVLHRDGYVVDRRDGRWYNGPDVDLLLADEFLDDHCFGVDTAGFANGRLGLTFAPVAKRRLPEIEGFSVRRRRHA